MKNRNISTSGNFFLGCLALITILLVLPACNGSQPQSLEDVLIGKWETPTRSFEHFDHGGLELTDTNGLRTGVWALETGDVLMWGFKQGNDPWEKEFYEIISWSENEFTFKPQGGGGQEIAVRK